MQWVCGPTHNGTVLIGGERSEEKSCGMCTALLDVHTLLKDCASSPCSRSLLVGLNVVREAQFRKIDDELI